MSELFLGLSATASLFVFFLILKAVFRRQFCVICASVSLTWITLLGLRLAGRFKDESLIAMLMGQSMIGIYYFLSKRLREDLRILLPPFIFTEVVLGYALLGKTEKIFQPVLLVLALWLLFGAVYAYRKNSKIRIVAQKIIACCKSW